MYERLIKPVYFKMDPERAHHLTIGGLAAAGSVPGATALLKAMYGARKMPELEMNLLGLTFPNPIGLAAGLDKQGEAVKAFSSIGFGFLEVGTVTPVGQPGNEQPRLFRLPSDTALINRMGFNNDGADKMVERLAKIRHRPIPVAVNIGKNKATPNDQAADDYIACIRKLYTVADLFVVNISSPNTPDLRKLQHGDDLKELLRAAADEIASQSAIHGYRRPILVKLSPDLTDAELENMIETITGSDISGIVATNTTLGRDGLIHPNRTESGGLSGIPLRARSTEVIRSIYRLTSGKLPIIGSGGIFSAEDAYEKIRAGASLVEIYTSLIYKGPGVNREIARGLSSLLRRDGLAHISQAIGTGQ